MIGGIGAGALYINIAKAAGVVGPRRVEVIKRRPARLVGRNIDVGVVRTFSSQSAEIAHRKRGIAGKLPLYIKEKALIVGSRDRFLVEVVNRLENSVAKISLAGTGGDRIFASCQLRFGLEGVG